jgi:hypothetical protein
VIAPLSLSNVLTVLFALACVKLIASQTSQRLWSVAFTVAPAMLSSSVALLLLTEELSPTLVSDGLWALALLAGFLVGRKRGWSLALTFYPEKRRFSAPQTWDNVAAALVLAVLAGIDTVSAVNRNALVDPEYTAAVAALCSGYFLGRSFVLTVRVDRTATSR